MKQVRGMLSSLHWLTGLGLLILLAAPVAMAQDPAQLNEQGIISGEMNIDFQTRTTRDLSGKLADGSPAENTKDTYNFTLSVAKTTEFSGSITRQPRLLSKVLGREKQPAQLQYDVTLAVRNPNDLTQKRNVGKWVGLVPIDEKGTYSLGGGEAVGSQIGRAHV
mgnify:CR=1 FL=1